MTHVQRYIQIKEDLRQQASPYEWEAMEQQIDETAWKKAFVETLTII